MVKPALGKGTNHSWLCSWRHSLVAYTCICALYVDTKEYTQFLHGPLLLWYIHVPFVYTVLCDVVIYLYLYSMYSAAYNIHLNCNELSAVLIQFQT